MKQNSFPLFAHACVSLLQTIQDFSMRLANAFAFLPYIADSFSRRTVSTVPRRVWYPWWNRRMQRSSCLHPLGELPSILFFFNMKFSLEICLHPFTSTPSKSLP